MDVLSPSKSVLVRTFLYKKSEWMIGHMKISYVILNCLFVLPMVLNIILMSNRICVELMNGGGFKEISGSFYISFGTMSTVCIYASLATSYKLIIELMEHIEDVVNHRK